MAKVKNKKPRILIVEDDGIIVARLKHILTNVGYAIPGVAASGKEAIQQAAEARPDLVLMDIHLSGEMDGIQAAVQIHTRFDLPVIYLTAYADDDLLQRAKITAPYSYLVKPVRDRELYAAIEIALHRHELEKKLRESEARYRAVVQDQTEMISRYLPDGTLTFVNDAFCLHTAKSRKELIGQSWEPLVFKENPEKVKEHISSLNQENPVGTFEFENRTLDGKIRWEQWTNRAIFDAQDRLVEYQSVGRDITARVRAEEELRESGERFRRVISSISDCIYVTQVTENGDYINRYLSPHIEVLTGYPLEKLMADWHFWLSAVVHPDDKAAATTNAERLAKGQDTEIEYRMIRADDNVIWVRDSAKIYRSDDGSKIIYGVVSDITARKQAEKALWEINTTLETQVAERTAELQQRAVELEAALVELREAQERLLRSERLAVIGELAGSVAHDLRNPLGVISSSAYYIRRKLTQTGQADERILGSLEQMEKNVVASDRIIRGLLEFARVSPPELRPTDINQAVRSALADAPLPPPNEVAVVTHLAEGLPQIPLDAQQLERVFVNLITNAVQAMPERGQLEVRTWRDREMGNIVVSISDVGEGIPPENMARIFEPLFSTKVHGTGLGLPICQRIVEAHGGSIEIESQVGAGSTFTVRLPLTNE